MDTGILNKEARNADIEPCREKSKRNMRSKKKNLQTEKESDGRFFFCGIVYEDFIFV